MTLARLPGQPLAVEQEAIELPEILHGGVLLVQLSHVNADSFEGHVQCVGVAVSQSLHNPHSSFQLFEIPGFTAVFCDSV